MLSELRLRTKLHKNGRTALSIRLIRWGGHEMKDNLNRLWSDEKGQDIAEYAVMLAVILVIVVGTVRLIGTNASNIFSSVASSLQ